ncbi:MAG: acetate--CoA ligase family protein [Deltaproteobacteria bacterium]|nr:acetate--CoA ligase family protein [Deltaproteobacteria bacterium]
MDPHTLERMNQLFSPKHIAVVGASTKNPWFRNMVMSCNQIEFKGGIYPVNPNRSEICGIKTCKSIADLPFDIDFGVVIVNHRVALNAVKNLNKRGIKNIVLISSGYAETGQEGRAKQGLLQKYCAENDIFLIGPNCLGFINPDKKTGVFAGRAIEKKIIPGKIGVIGQSGAGSELIANALLKKSLGISLYIATGNEAVLTIEDFMEYLILDSATEVITGFIEGFRDIPRLKRLALMAAKRKIPLILIKVGQSKEGVRVAESHTGAIAGNDMVIDGFFKQFGIIRVDTIEELADTAGIFTHCPIPKGDGLGIYTISGGMCGIFADLCSKYKIKLPSLTNETVIRLRSILPEFAIPDNPLDVTGAGMQDRIDEVIESFMRDENIDILAPLCIPPGDSKDTFANNINKALIGNYNKLAKPMVPITFKEMSDYARDYFKENNIYYIEQPEAGFRAISHLITYGKFLRRLNN